MTRQIRDYHERTGCAVGFKPAGGIRKAKQALDWLILMKEELGERWLRASLFRLGASALLTDLDRQREDFVTCRYSAVHQHPLISATGITLTPQLQGVDLLAVMVFL